MSVPSRDSYVRTRHRFRNCRIDRDKSGPLSKDPACCHQVSRRLRQRHASCFTEVQPQAVAKALATDDIAPKELVAKVNRVMWRNTTEDKFITLFYALVDAKGSTLQFTNAGHNAPILTRQDGTQVWLDEGGLIVGAFQQVHGGATQPANRRPPGDVYRWCHRGSQRRG